MIDARSGLLVAILLAMPVLALPVLAADEPFYALHGMDVSPLAEHDLAAIEGQGAEHVSTTVLGVPTNFVLAPSGNANGAAHGDSPLSTPSRGAVHVGGDI